MFKADLVLIENGLLTKSFNHSGFFKLNVVLNLMKIIFWE